MDAGSIALLVLVLPHLIGAVFLAWWILPASARGELRGWFREDDGGAPPLGRPPEPGGSGARASSLPLPDASPSAVRMREPGRLLDGVPGTPRRPVHPADPERRREPQPR
ncbi:MAG: hypothetical protein ITG02_14200 [Patulibacter sp.]|nr:hypothetical protein [Patulibacter sp.]